MRTQIKLQNDPAYNPLDHVEDVLDSHNWTFNRMNDDELIVQVTGKSCDYRLFFLWQDDLSALQFCCQYDLSIPQENTQTAARTLMSINENVWMGHFDIPSDTMTPSFRQTSLFRGVKADDALQEQIEDLVDISMAQCERYYAVFYLMAEHKGIDIENLALALMHSEGEA